MVCDEAEKNKEELGLLDFTMQTDWAAGIGGSEAVIRKPSLGWVSAAPGRPWAMRLRFRAVLSGLVAIVSVTDALQLLFWVLRSWGVGEGWAGYHLLFEPVLLA